MEKVLQYVWIGILGYGGFLLYGAWMEHTEVITSIEQRIPAIEGKIRRAKKEKKQIKTYLRDIEEAKQNIEIVAMEVEKLQKKLPETIRDAENLGLIKKLAESLNIKNIFLSPGIEENKGFYFTKRYDLSASGTFLQFLIFFEKIGASERLLNIRALEIKKSEDKQRGRFQLVNAKISVEAYRYNPDHIEERGISKIETDFKNKKPVKRKGKKGKKKGKKK